MSEAELEFYCTDYKSNRETMQYVSIGLDEELIRWMEQMQFEKEDMATQYTRMAQIARDNEDRHFVRILLVLINDAKKVLKLNKDYWTPDNPLFPSWMQDSSGGVMNISSHFIDTRPQSKNLPDLHQRMRYILEILESNRCTPNVRKMLFHVASMQCEADSKYHVYEEHNPIDTMIQILKQTSFANVTLTDQERERYKTFVYLAY